MTMTIERGSIELVIPKDITNGETIQQLKNAAMPLFEAAAPLCMKAREILVTDPSDKPGIALARATRLKLREIRIDADKMRKALKDESLKKGQAIDKIFNGLRDGISEHEEHLQEQEEFAERAEAAHKADLKASRDAVLIELGVDPQFYNTGEMNQGVFDACIDGIKARIKAEIEAAEKSEREKIAREKAEAEERERQRQENLRLRAEAEERERQMQAEREAAAKKQREIELKAKAERDAAEAKARAERAKLEQRAKVEREAAEAVARKEREAREKAEADLRAKQDQERKAKEAQAAAERRAKRAPDREKIVAFVKAIVGIEKPKLADESLRGMFNEKCRQLDVIVKGIEQLAQM